MFSKEDIKQYNTVSEVENFRRMVNEACDSRVKYINSCVNAAGLGEKSFGFIKECFENLSESLFKTKEGKKIINRYISTIKEDKGLIGLYSIYENLRKMGKDSDVDYFINSLNETVNIESVSSKSLRKLGNLLSEAYILLGESADGMIPAENNPLDKAIEYVAENKKGMRNLAEYSNAVKIIRESIEGKSSTNMFRVNESINDAEKLIMAFNSKYNGELNDDEKAMIKKLSESDDKESVFKQCKDDCINRLSEVKKGCGEKESERMDEIMSKVNGKQFCDETVESDICNLIEITKMF